LVSILLVGYVYVGYPVVLILVSKLRKPLIVNKKEITPTVSLIVSCYNESDVIEDKIINCLAIDYPQEKFEIVFVSDASDDGTDEVVKKYSQDNIRLIRQNERAGKTSALNLAIPQLESEIIVFSDANAMYEKSAIRNLVRNFNDEKIGYVVGAALYTDSKESASAECENSYWKYEIAIKEIETNLHSVVGGDGAIFAIRRKHYETLDKEDINDFVIPLQIIAKGYRGVFDKEAICFEKTAGDFEKEGKRKQRIVNRSFRGLMRMKEVLNPFRFGIFSFEIISHKLLRWLVPFFVLGIFFGTMVLVFYGIIWAKIFMLFQILCFWLASIGFIKSDDKNLANIFYYPFYFLIVNYQSMLGVLAALQGNIQVTWSTARSQDGASKKRSELFYLFSFGNIICMSLFLQIVLWF
jgi:cellulose synthase/poly-beta-1,6-N-acetylglucosamine synthase-like glycosyltransferase